MSFFSNAVKPPCPELPNLVKMPISEAIEVAKKNGYVVRLVEVDGEPYSLESAFNSLRINLKVENNIVVEAGVG